ncbi:MAG: 2-C-methyl-D-erythritol 2,4-cyclodiphosphate synthase [Thermomicrobiales bacterium]
MTIRTGIGYDVHRFTPGRPLKLGGVEISFELGLEGHSDADVLLHAIADALLGAAAKGDIGQHFPPDDPAYRDASSLDLLRDVMQILRSSGFHPVNLDTTLICEAPKIARYADAMRSAISNVTGLDDATINIKATTNEGMGFIGRGEGIAALAIATVRESEQD